MTRRYATLPAVIAAVFAATHPAYAHHGWSWAEAGLTKMTGTITAIETAPPHPTLTVEDGEGRIWTVELGNPAQTLRAGFTEDVTQPGETVTILGNRDRDESQTRIKAVRITIEGQNYDMYPNRIPDDA